METQLNDHQIQLLNELRKSAKENGIKRLDDEYLWRYLQGHEYNVAEALKVLQNYEEFISKRKEKWLNLNKSFLKTMFESQVIDILKTTGTKDQVVCWIRVEKWDCDAFTTDNILQISALLCEFCCLEFKDAKYLDVIFDLKGLSLNHVTHLSPQFANKMNYFMAECNPFALLNIYLIRQPVIFQVAYAIFKPFIPEKFKKIISICGEDFDLLVSNIGPDVLPEELGGNAKEMNAERWLDVIHSKKYEKELKAAGYNFYER